MDEDLQLSQLFPAWLRRLQPAYEAIWENQVYRAYYRRRTIHRNFWRRLFKSAGSAGSSDGAETGVAIALLLVIVILLTGGLILLVLPLAYKIIEREFDRIQGRRRFKSPRLPDYLSGTLSAGGHHPSSSIDIWMTGVRGHHIIETLVLESSESWIGSAIASVAVSIICMVGVALAGHPLSFFSLVAYAVMTWTSVRLFRFAAIASVDIGLNNSRSLIRVWAACVQPPLPWRERIIKAVRDASIQMVATVARLAVIVLTIVGLVLLLNEAMQWVENSRYWPVVADVGSNWVPTIVATGAALLGLVLPRITRHAVRRQQKLLDDFKKQADELYDAYMRLVVLQDPDGAPDVMPLTQHTRQQVPA